MYMNPYRNMMQMAGFMMLQNARLLGMLRPPAGAVPQRTAYGQEPKRSKSQAREMPKAAPLRRTPAPPVKPKKRTRAVDVLLDPARYTASQISPKDLSHIIGLYGTSVEDIYELGAGQKWMLEAGQQVKNAFFLQILTKAVIDFEPAAFRQRVDEVCRSHESLRSAFVTKGTEQPYRVVLKDRHGEVNCFDFSDMDMESFDEKIQKQMETDRKRGFNLERDPLLRIQVYKSCEKDTYAIILSQPHLNSDGTSLGLLFADLFVGYALDMNGIDKKLETQTYQSYAEHLEQVDTEKELAFWKKNLDGMAEDQLLPGQQESTLDYDSASLFVPFEERELSLLKQAQKAFGVTRFTLLQGLWGLMVAKLKQRNHIVFGAITSGRDAEVGGSMRLSGGFVNALPVKVSFAPGQAMADFFQGLQQNFVQALENSHCSPGQIREALGHENGVFSHILNLHNFAKPKSSGFSPGGFSGLRFIGGEVYDNLSEDLCVYFTNMDGREGCNYSYNSRAFSREVIALLAESYKSMLAALDGDLGTMTVDMLPELDTDMFQTLEQTRRLEEIKIAGSLKKHPVFGGAEDSELLALAACCRMEHYSGEEIITRSGELLEAFPLLLSGKAVLYGETMHGWSNPIRGKKAGSFLSLAPLFEEEKASNTVVNGFDEAVVLFIPRQEMLEFLERHPEGMRELARTLYKEGNSFMKLWINAD